VSGFVVGGRRFESAWDMIWFVGETSASWRNGYRLPSCCVPG